MNRFVSLLLPLLVQGTLSFTAFMGALQIIASRHGLEGLAWLAGPQRRRVGTLLAGLLIGIAFLGGLLLPALPGAPPPALLGATALFAGGGLALPAALVGASVRLRWSERTHHALPSPGQPLALGPLSALFYRPEGQGPFPALCLLPDPTAPGDDLTRLVHALTSQRIAVLALDGRSLGTPDRLTLQGYVAVGISHLTQWPETDAGLIGLVGVGLGGDLALRSAAMDSGVTAVAAIEPVLSPHRPGLGLEALHTLSWLTARRRAHRWHRSPLVRELDALAAIPRIAPRPAAIIVGCAEGPTSVGSLEILRTEEGCTFMPATHQKAVNRAARWLKEHLS